MNKEQTPTFDEMVETANAIAERDHTCECCEDVGKGDGWLWGENGWFCPPCGESLTAEARRMAGALPLKLALCPQCAPEFYYPLNEGEEAQCPTPGCGMEMVVYVRSRLPECYQ